MEVIESHRGTVYPRHCDHIGHMNVMWYVGKFDEGSWDFLHAIGYSPEQMCARQRGMVAVKQEIQYLSELVAGDIVAVRTRLLKLGGSSMVLEHAMPNAGTGAPVALMNLTCVHIDMANRKSVPVETDVRERALPFVAKAA